MRKNQEREYNVIIGKRIRFFRELRGLSQPAFQKAMGFKSSGIVSLLERGERGMRKENLLKASRVLAVHPHVLQTKENLSGEDLILLNKFTKVLKLPVNNPARLEIKSKIEHIIED